MTQPKLRVLAWSLLATTFVILCENVVILGVERNPLSIIGIVLGGTATVTSAVMVYLTSRK